MESKRIVILGAGTAGTIMANRLVKSHFKRHNLNITIVDDKPEHLYQPGLLFLPFGLNKEADIIRSKAKYISKKVRFLAGAAQKIDADQSQVVLSDGQYLAYDVLVVATGAHTVPEETDGLKGPNWYKSIFDFYTLEGAQALREHLKTWQGGRLVVHITEMPIKCPVAPLEFSFLADDFFKKRGIRDKVEITYVTPLTGAFTKPKASEKLGYLLQERSINVVSDFSIERVDNEKKAIVSYDGNEVQFDLLVSIPTNKGSEVVAASGLGDELNYMDTDHKTLQSKKFPNIFVAGDATNVPASKAGSTAHFETKTLEKNIMRYLDNQQLLPEFDGHANCFVESGGGKALLLDFDYEVEPLEGTFPFAEIGPMKLLKETRLNHIGKKLFRYVYWYFLLKARPIPFIPSRMKMSGKKVDKNNEAAAS